MQEEVDIFNKYSGEVLSHALSVESSLEFFISNYFVKPQTSKTHFFNDEVTLNLNFERKIGLFKEICKREGFDKNKLDRIIKSIKHVQEARNKVAHWQSEIPSPELKIIQLRKRKSFTTARDILKLNEEFMKKIDEERLKALKGITDFYLKYSREGTVDEKTEVDKVV